MPMTKAQVVALLKENRNERGMEHWDKMGAASRGELKSFGIGLTQLRKLAKHNSLLLDDLDGKFTELVCINDIGRFGHQVGRPLRLRERDAISDVLQAGEQHHPAVDTQRDAAMGRRTIF